MFRDASISDGAKLLATCFCDTFAHHKTGFCNPTVATLGEALGKSDRAIQRALVELGKAGWIEVEHARGRGKTSHILFLTGDDPAAFGAAEKVTRLSASQPERVPDVSPFTPERVTLAVEKGD